MLDTVLRFRIPREYLETWVSVILRTPALFILEAWFRSDLSLALHGASSDVHLLTTVAYYSVVLVAVVLATIPVENLVMLYMYMLSLMMLSAVYLLSGKYIAEEESSDDPVDGSLLSALRHSGVVTRMTLHLLAQCVIAAMISYLIGLKGWPKYLLLVFTLPIIARLCGLPARDLIAVHNFSTLVTIVMLVFYSVHILSIGLQVLRDSIALWKEAVIELGWIPILVTYWHAVMLPVQLLLFWTGLLLSQMYVFYQTQKIPKDGHLIWMLAIIGDCCATPISLFALCIAISYLSYYILTLTKVFLLGWEGLVHDNDLLRGWTEGFTMLLVAVQTGILDLDPLQRAFLMSILLFIVVSSLIQSMYEITDPILLGLSASHSRSLNKHLRAVALCTVMWTLPLYMTFMICQYFDLDLWLMIIISSCILTSVQVIGSLLVYWLFLFDSFRTEPWENLDDVVYYIRSSVRVLEFLVAVFVVCFGIKESISTEWSSLNAIILIVHCYFNVWQRLQSGWKTFLLRREAVKKIESLPEATKEQLSEHNDVCAICFQDMKCARITLCGHYFHGCCLRKWLYVKDSCPLCHQKINASSNSRNEANDDEDNIDILNMAEDNEDGDNQDDFDVSDLEEDEEEEELDEDMVYQ